MLTESSHVAAVLAKHLRFVILESRGGTHFCVVSIKKSDYTHAGDDHNVDE